MDKIAVYNSDHEDKQKINSITGIRGIACLFIVCFHFYCLIIEDQGMGYDSVPWISKSKYIFAYSKNAVELFFMISGFLTAWTYRMKITSMSFKEYFKKHYSKLITASAVVNIWALFNILVRYKIGLTSGLTEPTLIRFILSVLMINTGWFTSYSQTKLPINTTMWFVDVLLLCYLLYYLVAKLGKKDRTYIGLCGVMVLLGWICLEHSPRLPFLWAFDGRGYTTFFLGALLAEFQSKVNKTWRVKISAVWGAFIVLFFIFHLLVGFESVFGEFGTSNYVRYFEYVAAPGIILSVLNLNVPDRIFSWEPLLQLGALSSMIYYIHNNCIEDYLILNTVSGSIINLSSFPAFLFILLSVIPIAMLCKKLSAHFFELPKIR